MANSEQITSAIVGAAALVYGIYTIVTRRAALSSDDTETNLWLYGWRAVLVGVFALMMAALCFASALGWVALSSS
ncbi:MAG TPA: hypothetical protein VGM81_01970 [Burkholderiaceae bacterium]|jgi:uncharacterized membrane protein HdeD (DUF308 family)